MKNFSLKQAFSCEMTEFVKWVCDARMVIVAVLLIFINNFAVSLLTNNAELMGEPLNILEPFIAVANTVFYIVRIGRANWFVGQVLKLVFMIVSYLAVIFLGTVLPMLSKGFWYNGWSNVATGFVKMFPDRRGDFGVALLPENLYNQLSVFEAAVKSYLLVAAYLMIIGLILLVFSLFKRKTLGFIICGGMISLGMAFSAIRTNLMWTMPMANSITWLHYTKYFKKPIMPMSFSVIYLLVLIAVLLVFGGIAIGKFNYDNVTEVAS